MSGGARARSRCSPPSAGNVSSLNRTRTHSTAGRPRVSGMLPQERSRRMTDESLPGARCPLIVCPFQRVMGPRSRRQRSRAAAGAPLFLRPGEHHPERSRREPQRRRSGQGQCRDRGCSMRLAAEALFRRPPERGSNRPRPATISYLAPDIVDAIVEGRQPRPLTIRLLFQGIPLSWSDQRATFGSSIRIEKQAAKGRADHS